MIRSISKKTYQCVAVRSYGHILDHFCRYWARARQRNKNYSSTQFSNLESSNSYAVDCQIDLIIPLVLLAYFVLGQSWIGAIAI